MLRVGEETQGLASLGRSVGLAELLTSVGEAVVDRLTAEGPARGASTRAGGAQAGADVAPGSGA